MRQFAEVCKVLEEYNYERKNLIPILYAIQSIYRYLPKEILEYVASALKISPAEIYGVATFYSYFTLEPKGKYVIRVCDGTACHVRGSRKLVDILQKELGLNEKKKTSSDLLFTLETVSCLGACGLAPVMVVNDEVYGLTTDEKVKEVIKNLKEKEGVIKTEAKKEGNN
jgi:NADH-quinone oxidoreductase subunit E